MVLVNPLGWPAKQASNEILSAVVLMLQNGSGKSIVNAHSDAVRMDERLHCNKPTLDIVGGGRSKYSTGIQICSPLSCSSLTSVGVVNIISSRHYQHNNN